MSGTTSAGEKIVTITPAEFFSEMAINSPDVVQAVVTLGPLRADGEPSFDHDWNLLGDSVGESLADKSKHITPAFFTLAGFKPSTVTRWKGRSQANALMLPGFWVDVEGSKKKYDKPDGPSKGYINATYAMAAVKEFIKVSGLKPSSLVATGSGGFHLYYRLSEPIMQVDWLPRANALTALAALHKFKIDSQVTTDAARVMRAPGSIHQDTGKEVKAYRVMVKPYTLVEFDAGVGYISKAVDTKQLSAPPAYANGENNDELLAHVADRKPYSYKQAAMQCGAMHQAAMHNGRDTGYDVWYIAAKTADLSIEGRALAHEISSGHADYDEAATDKKLDSLTGGPAGCDKWANAYGIGGPCDTCGHRGCIKNPAAQLGTVVDTSPPGEVAISTPKNVPQWVAELNQRYAFVRYGPKMVVVDLETPSLTGQGVSKGFGFLDVAAFRAMLNGRFVPVEKEGEKQRSLADAWLAHPTRSQYEGLVFAPEGGTPPNILNMWTGYAVKPVAADVRPWLRVLMALVPNPSERRYVLCWLAWKIQNPGGVPDTILIFKGAKGTGKNSLFDPIIAAFGSHGMLADDPELIAGTFTWHLVTVAFAVLDEAVFAGDPRQTDKIKARVTAKTMLYHQKGFTPVSGVNHCAYVMLTNHDYVWQATTDERRAVVIEVGQSLRGNLTAWAHYHAWANRKGSGAILHFLQSLDITGFNPRNIPKGESLRKQIEHTALRSSAAAWWNQCLTEGEIRYKQDGSDRTVCLDEVDCTEIHRVALRLSYEQSAAARTRNGDDWAAVAKKVKSWAGPRGITSVRAKAVAGAPRGWLEVLPPLSELKAAFTAATQVEVAS